MNKQTNVSTQQVSTLDALLSLSSNAIQVTKKARIRTAKIEFIKVIDSEYEGGDPQQTILSLVQYQDDPTKKWRERKSDLSYPEGCLLQKFISQEIKLGNPIFDGSTLYTVKAEINKRGYPQWTSIERLDKESSH